MIIINQQDTCILILYMYENVIGCPINVCNLCVSDTYSKSKTFKTTKPPLIPCQPPLLWDLYADPPHTHTPSPVCHPSS